MTESIERVRLGRRGFLKKAAAGAAVVPMAGGLIAAACSDDKTTASGTASPEFRTPAASTSSSTSNTPASGGTVAASQQSNWQKIDADHKKGIEQYLANNTKAPITSGKGNVPLAPRIENGVKVWDLTIDEVEWETIPGQKEKARGYNKMIPGPVLRGTVGDKVKINFKNNLAESTAVHWHGLYVPNNMDGVPYITQDPIEPGKSFTYEFTLRNSGPHMYHSHHDSADQVNRGLLGAFIVDPVNMSSMPKYDKEVILVLNDVALGFTINGKGFPATELITAKKGERLLVRWLNEGMMNHPMHLHGMPMQVTAIDGWPLTAPYLCDTIDVPPGNRYDTIIECTEPGVWAFHCHILSHAESPAGFFGLVTAIMVTE